MNPADDLARLFELFESEIGDVDETLSPGDTMFGGDEPHYRRVGESAIQCTRLALLAAHREPASIRTILDFPCGHGRVLRYLQRVLPHANYTACDIDRAGVDFCAETFGTAAVYSNEELTGIEFPAQYDLIWCGSLFTHLGADRWAVLLRLFESILAPKGLLLFTTGGRTVPQLIENGWDYGLPTAKLIKVIDDYRRDGFGFVEYDGHERYGISVARPSWTSALLERITSLSVLLYLERGWDNHQDVVICTNRMPDLPAGPDPAKTSRIDLGDL